MKNYNYKLTFGEKEFYFKSPEEMIHVYNKRIKIELNENELKNMKCYVVYYNKGVEELTESDYFVVEHLYS